MIAFLSSNFLSLPELPSVSRSKDSRRFARYYGGADRVGYCSKELNAGSGWENEGGASGPERNRHESPFQHRQRNARASGATDENMLMTQTTNHEEMIRYGDPLMGGGRRNRRGYPATNYNDRSPEVAAMNAHLRASAYDDQEERRQIGPTPRLTNGAILARSKAKSFLHLGRQYDMQARDNFTKEAILFGLIVALSIWPIIHAVHAMAAR